MSQSKKGKRIMNLMQTKLKGLENELAKYPMRPSIPEEELIYYVRKRDMIQSQILLLSEIIEISNETILLDD
ncbi:hypothetical protein V9L05_17705 [Bernardetia sp. Wsw4-3y2]|uniref:hypothetical protein n=1 Tax=Bernardetia sp. Wsw4-3y2 TaxID=3127471 RepID=UPI0030D02C4D